MHEMDILIRSATGRPTLEDAEAEAELRADGASDEQQVLNTSVDQPYEPDPTPDFGAMIRAATPAGRRAAAEAERQAHLAARRLPSGI